MKFIENGPFTLYVEKHLSGKDYYEKYKNKEINSAQFQQAMLADEELKKIEGFHDFNIWRISMMPPDEKMPVDYIIDYLIKNNILPPDTDVSDTGAYDGLEQCREFIHKSYNHGEFFTCVFPEDERLLYAAARLCNPRNVFVAGSYYGYLAVWAMPVLKENGGVAVLSDIDEEVCALARHNYDKLGYGNNAEIHNSDAEILLKNRTEPIDMLVLDATGLHDDPRAEYRGKRIYGSLLKAAKHLLKEGSFIVIHNMEPQNPDMKELVDELKNINAQGTNHDTYNGIGIYVKVG